jgi:hypothetical protein
MRLRRVVSLALAAAALSGCPEERPDAKRPPPRDRLPPAMPVQPRPTIAPATPTPDADPAREGSAPAGEPGAQPTPEPTPGAAGAPTR